LIAAVAVLAAAPSAGFGQSCLWYEWLNVGAAIPEPLPTSYFGRVCVNDTDMRLVVVRPNASGFRIYRMNGGLDLDQDVGAAGIVQNISLLDLNGDAVLEIVVQLSASIIVYGSTPAVGAVLPGELNTRQEPVLGAFPNPFAGPTKIALELAKRGDVVIQVFDVGGRLVRLIKAGPREGGHHEVDWDGRDDAGKDLPSGVYFCRSTVDGEAAGTEKVVRLSR
jgi:hypothetical protein